MSCAYFSHRVGNWQFVSYHDSLGGTLGSDELSKAAPYEERCQDREIVGGSCCCVSHFSAGLLQDWRRGLIAKDKVILR